MERIELPWDLIEEILSRVPTKSLARLQSTSRRWNALSKSGSFALQHSANAPKESLSIMLIDSRVCLVRINVNGIHENVAPSVKVAAQFDLEDPLSSSSQVDIREVFHCDGLLLCSTMDDRLVVWNPCLGETKWVKPRVSYKKRDDNYALGYENKSSCKHYKILRVDYKYPDRSEFEIYDFTSDSWRVIGPSDWALPGRGISVRGNTYWTAFNYSCSIPYCLVSFDFSTEKFESSSLPKFDFRVAVLSLVREEQIFLLGSDCAYKFFSVWVRTTSPGSIMSWSKFLTVEDKLTTFSTALSFLADEQNNAVMCCDYGDNILHIVAEDKHIKHVVRHGGGLPRRSYYRVLLSYVPSLAQIQQGKLLGD